MLRLKLQVIRTYWKVLQTVFDNSKDGAYDFLNLKHCKTKLIKQTWV